MLLQNLEGDFRKAGGYCWRVLVQKLEGLNTKAGGVNSHSLYREAAFFSALHVPGVFSLINVLIRTSVSRICRSPDLCHLNVPDHVKNLEVSPFCLPFEG